MLLVQRNTKPFIHHDLLNSNIQNEMYIFLVIQNIKNYSFYFFIFQDFEIEEENVKLVYWYKI